MKAIRIIVLCGCAMILLVAAVPRQEAEMRVQAPAGPHPGFEKMKTLAGEWEGTSGEGNPATVSYRLVSGGTALEETLTSSHEGNRETMVTMYYLDGDGLMMTHFCAAGNQPRMRAGALSAAGKTLAFAFRDATNLPNPNTGHMRNLEITFVDAKRITQQWTWRENGQEKKDVFRLTRRK